MCDPISIAVGLAVATTSAKVIGDVQSANAANASIKAQQAVQAHEIDQATSDEINQRLRQMRRDEARISVAAGESGLSLESGSVKALQSDAEMQASLSNETSLANRESRQQASIADANAKMVSKPTLLGAGLQIALSGASAAQSAGAFKGTH